MRKAAYLLVKMWIKAGLYLYYGKIKVEGLENVPKDAPILFLPNHQSALLDVLLLGIDCNRKPYFLTRSDIFVGKFIKSVFSIFQMIPIYRIRDGRESLKNNQAVFDTCSELLINKEAILMFPEANHNLKRRVRPLSKGFTRILFNTLNKAPDTEIVIVAVGINYRNAISFPDKVAVYFDTPIAVNEMYDSKDVKGSIDSIKAAVSGRLKTLTTHIADEVNYNDIAAKLDSLQVDYLKPEAVNKTISELQGSTLNTSKHNENEILRNLLGGIFVVLNFPIVLIWRKLIKPKVWEPEFTGTLRFGFAMLGYPIFFAILFAIVALTFNAKIALIIVLALFLYNWIYVRWN